MDSPGRAAAAGATVVITHRVREGHAADYDRWLEVISDACRAFPGFVDWQIVRPLADVTFTYTVIIRFDTEANLRAWLGSDRRKRLVESVSEHLVRPDEFVIRSGLDFWFMPDGAPVRWKQFLITWSAIYPLVLVVPLAVLPILRWAGLPEHRVISTGFVSATVVLLMVYVVMPRYTRLVKGWLFRKG